MKLNEFINGIVSHPDYVKHLNSEIEIFTMVLGEPLLFNSVRLNFCADKEDGTPENLVQVEVGIRELEEDAQEV